jgi:hypothetical protein
MAIAACQLTGDVLAMKVSGMDDVHRGTAVSDDERVAAVELALA